MGYGGIDIALAPLLRTPWLPMVIAQLQGFRNKVLLISAIAVAS